MKKTIKTAVSMLLAVIIACGSLTAFAAAPSDIQWSFGEYEETVIYLYAGEIAVGAGEVAVAAKEDNCCAYFTFVAEEDGCYRVCSLDCGNSGGWYGIPEKRENGICYNVKNGFFCCDADGCYYYLEKGEYIVGVDFYGESEYVFEVEFLGDIVDMEWAEGSFDNLILNSDFWISYYENSDASYLTEASVTVAFSGGHILEAEYRDVLIFTDEELKGGTYEVEVGLDGLNFRKKATISVIDIAEEIVKVELSNLEDYATLIRYYTGDYYSGDIEYGTLTVTYADGTTEVFENFNECAWLEKYNVYINAFYSYNDDWDVCFFVNVAEESFINEICTVREATRFENIGNYNRLNLERIGYTFDWMGFYFDCILYSKSIPDVIENIDYFFTESISDWLYTFAFIMRNTADIFSYIF